MKKLRIQQSLMALLVFLLLSCSNYGELNPDIQTGENVAVIHLGPVLNEFINQQTRQSIDGIPECSAEGAGFAQISLTYGNADVPVDVIAEILVDEKGLFTAYDESLGIPIPEGATTVSVTLNEFLILTDLNGAPGEVIWAAPKSGSDYAIFAENPLPITWDLIAGSKTYINVEVLCFDERQVNLYGYQFFDIIPEIIYEVCFFANYCSDAGRHYTAKYSLDIYYGVSPNGTSLYKDEVSVTGVKDEFYADPLCLPIPAPQNDEADDVPYLYYEARLLDWPDNYGSANGQKVSGTWSWNDIKGMLNEDGETSEYFHAFFNCEEDNSDCGEFEAIPESSFYESIIPEEPVDFFEIVTYLDEIIYTFSEGALCVDAENTEECMSEFNALIAEDGFVISCLPAGCYTFIREQTDGVNQLITTDEKLLEFLGTIDSKGDALLLAMANDYYWNRNDVENGAIRDICNGYELIVSKIVSFCAPLQIERFRLKITPSAEIIILDQEIIEFGEDLCI
ncbi:hypothetical protein [Christiangramia sp.]|uniref:hypothetical protein n=1 Tax=Christiangramia sp. TaxID=1931228 RepID=UPI002621773C|nr:hypothetical protein [Christiangramia sp.]